MNKNQEVANRINEMELSERARDMVAGTDINLFAELFGNATEEDLEAMATFRVFGNDCWYEEEYNSYDEAREAADEYEEEDADGTKYHVTDGYKNFLD